MPLSVNSSLASVEIFAYKLAMMPYSPFAFRKGFILKLKDRLGHTGYGEISPLPGWSRETLEDVKKELSLLKESSIQKISPIPSVAFGQESALEQLKASAANEANLLSQRNPCTAFLLAGSKNDILKKSENLPSQSYVKIKLSSLPIQEAVCLVNQMLENAFSIALDINEAWEKETALDFCRSFPPSSFRYIEEPVKDLKDYLWLAERTDHPFALDEKLRVLPLEDAAKIPRIKAWILKPTLMGGISICRLYAKAAQKNHIAVHLSSSFETGIGIWQILDAFLRNEEFQNPLGIDTMDFFAQDLLADPITFTKEGKILRPEKIHLNTNLCQIL
ncbi:MAG: o-succinylbenzoate synthase [Simkaniaceae bacterium]